MGEPANTFKLLGLTFSYVNLISGFVTFLLVFLLLFGLSRKIQMKPKGGQNVIEMLIDFTNGIVRGQLPNEEASNFTLYAFVMFVFVFISNQLGLLVQIGWNGSDVVRSPTADPIITMTLSLTTLMLAHFSGMAKFGFKGYFKNSYLRPFPALFPIKLFEEFGNFITLGLRLFGNIFAGETLLKLLGSLAFSHGVWTMIIALPLEMIWQGFSIFIGSIQAYVFVTLSAVYISQKVEVEE